MSKELEVDVMEDPDGRCEAIAVRDGAPRRAERCELPAGHDGDHVFEVPETPAAQRCPAVYTDEALRTVQCELPAGHDRGPKASPHMVDRGEGTPPLTWEGDRTIDVELVGTSGGDAPHAARDDPFTLSLEALHGLVYEAAGAATGPLLRDHPGYTFPSTEAAASVAAVLEAHGIPTIDGYPRELPDAPAPAAINPPELPRIAEGVDAMTVPFISARMADVGGGRLQAQLVERPEVVVVADSVPELQEDLWDALRELLASETPTAASATGWHIRYTYDLWSGKSPIEPDLEGQAVVLTEGTIDQAVEAVAARMATRDATSGGTTRVENVRATWVRALGRVIVG